MITADQLAELRARITVEVATWRPLDTDERDLVRRALAPGHATQQSTTSTATTVTAA